MQMNLLDTPRTQVGAARASSLGNGLSLLKKGLCYKKECMNGKTIENQTFDEERALYGEHDLFVRNCRFDGPADGESAFKECTDVRVDDTFMNLRYPFWHDHGLALRDVEMTELCRAALWYSRDVTIEDSHLHGIKALRECEDVRMRGCDIVSPEFGWSTRGIEMEDCAAASEYFMMRASRLHLRGVRFSGKYSFQYIEDAVIENCELDTKDAFCATPWCVASTSVGTAKTSPSRTASSRARSRSATARACAW